MRIIFILVLSSLFLLEATSQKNLNAAFIENKGQVVDQNGLINAKVLYILSLRGMNVQVHKNGFSYDTYIVEPSTNTTEKKENKFHKILSKGGLAKERVQKQFRFHRVDIIFEGANENPEIIKSGMSVDFFNYYNNRQNEMIKTKQVDKIVYKNLYKGIDLELVTMNKKEQKFEYNFIVHPGADINQIKLRYVGATATSLSKQNSVVLQTSNGKLEEKIPLSFEEATKKLVDVQYVQTNANTYGFKAGTYNPKQTLIIDPSPDRVFGTYYGGANEEYIALANTVGTDASENFYLCGNTLSVSGIATAGAHQTSFGGDEDVFIVKFNSSGVRQWATYFGGTGYDEGDGLHVDASGNIYVCGYTESTSSIATAGTQQTTTDGSGDGYLVKFNSSGVRQWATYYGSSATIDGFSSVSTFGTDIYAAGATFSTTGISTAGAHQANFGGITDGMLVKFNSNGVRVWGTYYGGLADDIIFNLHIDASANLFITGGTTSATGIATAGSHQGSLSGPSDGFVAKFNSSGVRQWGTYYGGTGDDGLVSAKTDGSGNIFLGGYTNSTTNVATAGTQQTTLGGANDGLLVKMNSTGVRQWGTYIGGSFDDELLSFHVLTDGTIYTVGGSNSTNGISTTGAYQTSLAGGRDAIILKYNTSGIRQWGSYYGGSGSDNFSGISITSGGSIYAAGSTGSTSGIASAGSHQTTLADALGDLFFVKFTDVITGISQLSLENGIKVYPNPVNKELIVSFRYNSNASFAAIYTIEGKLVVQKRINMIALAPLKMNVAGLQSGTYLLKIWNNKDQLISAEQIIVQH